MTPDTPADLALRFAAAYERAGERTPQGRVPSMEEVAAQRAAIARAAEAAGVGRLFRCARDGHLSEV
jgi:hypothetical protein